jgi:hypothetical protein
MFVSGKLRSLKFEFFVSVIIIIIIIIITLFAFCLLLFLCMYDVCVSALILQWTIRLFCHDAVGRNIYLPTYIYLQTSTLSIEPLPTELQGQNMANPKCRYWRNPAVQLPLRRTQI